MDTIADRPISLSECQSIIPNSVLHVNNAATKIATATDLVDLAKQIQSCEEFVTANASSRLHLIVDQMQYLKKQAESILLDMKRDLDLHKLPCNFVKKPGNTYHVYEKSNGIRYFGFLSPEDWGSRCPDRFIHSYTLLPDMTWLDADHGNDRANTDVIVKRIMCASNLLSVDDNLQNKS
ncbi:hypothetical protein PHET_04500 [Paragonimus heterotremus]|uniref:Uncharacterized protein n=1 Tax=Paragonimus heterotremus TaxID=100268 RepID=A0A8J4TM37_9TREM|nr:hypothetical protein PHET_04500 [Paragonimus heterotremus]